MNQPRVLSIASLLVLAIAPNLVSAETPIRSDYGKIEAIGVYCGSNYQPVNAGTVLGPVAGSVIGKACADALERNQTEPKART